MEIMRLLMSVAVLTTVRPTPAPRMVIGFLTTSSSEIVYSPSSSSMTAPSAAAATAAARPSDGTLARTIPAASTDTRQNTPFTIFFIAQPFIFRQLDPIVINPFV